MNQYEKDLVGNAFGNKGRSNSGIGEGMNGGGLVLNDTLSTAIVNVKVMADEIVRSVQEKSDLVNRDLVEPLDLYHKHYASTNNEIIKQANTFWTTLHTDRTQMLFAKESYHNT